MWDRGPWIGPTPHSTVPGEGPYRRSAQLSRSGGAGSYRGIGEQPALDRTGPVTDPSPRPRRPAHYADLTELIDAAGGSTPESRGEIASATAALLVRAGRELGADQRFIDLADRVGLDTLAELWRDAEPVSLPGALWALYLLRQWCRTGADEVVRLWRAGEPFAAADAVVAGVAPLADVPSLEQVADDVLSGAYRGDFAVALERAAALFRVLAAGRRELTGAEPDAGTESAAAELQLAERNDRAAADLTAAARQWRAGTLH